MDPADLNHAMLPNPKIQNGAEIEDDGQNKKTLLKIQFSTDLSECF